MNIIDTLRGGLLGVSTDMIGTPVDLVSSLMRPFGYTHEKPVGGSKWMEGLLGVNPTGSTEETVARSVTGMLSPDPMDIAKIGLLGMAAGHAKRGGQVGKNSEFYKGGQFLPSSEFTEKGAMQFPKALRAGNKAEVAPGQWLPRPADGAVPIIKGEEWDWQHFRTNGTLKPFAWDGYRQNPEMLQKALAKAESFNRGARWVTADGKLLDAAGNVIP